MTNYCSHCGARLNPGDRFCSECGHRTSGGSPPSPIVLTGIVGTVLIAGAVWAYVSLNSAEPADPADLAVAATTTTTGPAPTTTEFVPATTTVVDTTVGAIELSAAEIGEQYGDAVWRVEVEGCGYAGSGSSFAISPNHVVTNAHVIEYDSTPTLVSRHGVTVQGRVLGSSPVPDVAVVEVDGALPTNLIWASIESVSLGDPIVTLGYPAPDGDFTVSPGSVLSFGVEQGMGRFIRTDGQIDFGNSGGPTLNANGEVIGIATSLEENPTGAQLVPQIFSSDVVRPVVDAMLESPSYPEPFCEFVGGDAPVEDYTDFWTGIVASLPTDQYSYDGAYQWASDFILDTGLWADVLLSDLYSTLNPGYWAVYTGAFATRDEANEHCAAVEGLGYDCYSRLVSWYLEE